MTTVAIGDAQDSGPAVERRSAPRSGCSTGEALVPAGVGQEPALFPDLDAPVTAAEAFVPGEDGKFPPRSSWRMTRADLVPCTRCGLRGHTAGDPDRCLWYRGSLGLGGQARMAADQGQWGSSGRGKVPFGTRS